MAVIDDTTMTARATTHVPLCVAAAVEPLLFPAQPTTGALNASSSRLAVAVGVGGERHDHDGVMDATAQQSLP